MPDNLKATGIAAGLTPEEQKKLDDYAKALSVHQTLSNMPPAAANGKFNTLTPAQQQDLVSKFGNEDQTVAPQRSPLGTAFHYTFGALGHGLGYAGSHILSGLGNVSDFMTRAYRTGAIAMDQGVNLGDAWTIANDKGDKVFSPGRINDAKAKYGNDAVDIAMRIAANEKPGSIMATATPEQIKFLQLADPRNTTVAGMSEEDTKAARANFQDTLDAVNAAKYSPGRQFANLVTPAQLEGSGLFYKAVSGAVDAAYRVLADPLLIAGKAKRAWDVAHYAVDVVTGGNKAAEVFAKPNVQNFWNQYGEALTNYSKAQESGNAVEMIAAKKTLTTLAPEFGDSVIKTFQTAKIPVQDAKTAQAFFENEQQAIEMLKGSVGRQRVLIPQMNTARKLRIAAMTTGNKILDLAHIGPKLTDEYFYGGATTSDGIAKMFVDGREQIVNEVKANTNFKNIARFSTAYIQNRIDKLKALGTKIPMFEKEIFDVTAPDAADKIYQLARVGGLQQRQALMLKEAFNNIDEVGKRKDIYYGLWGTITEIRGMNNTLPGQQIVRQFLGKNKANFGLDEFSEMGSMPSDFSNFVAAPGMHELDMAASRNTLFQKMIGLANSNFANKMTSAWSFLTLAGPRYALRNAGEDLMVNLAIGNSPWGLAKQYHLNNRINTFLSAAQKADGGVVNWANNPLGSILRFTNRRDVNKYTAQLTNLKNTFESGQKELADLRKELSVTGLTASEKATKTARIAELEGTLKGGLVNQSRQIFANALTEGRLNRWREAMGMKPINSADAEILAEHIKYGRLDDALGEVTEAGLNTFTGNDYISRAENLVKQTGVSTHALTITPGETKLVKKPGERAFTPQALHQQDEASMYSWMLGISRYANDELGGIAIANMNDANPSAAINKMVEWMMNTKNGKQFLKDARLSNNMSAEEIARLNYNRARAHFIKRDNTLNEDLLNKVRVINPKTGEYEISGKIGINDLPRNPNDIPQIILGPTLVPAVEASKMTSSIVNNGWTFLGMSNSRMSRQPIVLNEIVKIRNQFKKSGFEDKWVAGYTKNIDPADTEKIAIAKNVALRDLADAVEERAISSTIQYVDNPLVRSQLAWNMKNFARFYRATEDFYRRMYKVVKYNPEAIVKGALTYDGIIHSGWVQQDDQGNSYFVYPGIGPTYNAIQGTLQRLGIGGEFKIPFPVNFGANIKMITPSLNPDSLVPTFSGPVAGLSFTVISEMVNIWSPGAADTIKGYALGKYAVDQPIISALLPAHINRLYAAMNTDDRNSQYASAYRKAVTYLEASGHGIPKKYDQDGNLIPPTSGELEKYRQQVRSTTLGILGLRFAFGFFAPASPQTTLKSDMAQWISDNGRANFKQTWNDLLAQYPGDYNAAFAKWVELYPNEIPFTVTESERSTVAPIRYAQEAGQFVDANKDLFAKYPQGAAYLIPHKGGFSFDAYKTMKTMGIITNKRVEDYLLEVQTAADLQTYYGKKAEFDASLQNAYSTQAKTTLRKEFDAWKSVFLAGHPLVSDELSKGSQKAINRQKALDDLTNMLMNKPGVAPKTEAALQKMVDAYQNYKQEADNVKVYGGSRQYATMLKTNVLLQLQELAKFNENTKAAYDTIFANLLGA